MALLGDLKDRFFGRAQALKILMPLGFFVHFSEIHAQDLAASASGYQIGAIQLRGDRCGAPDQSSVILNSDLSAASVLLSDLFLQAEGSLTMTHAHVQRSRCTLRIPITLASGFALSGFEADLRGFAELSERASARMFLRHLLWVPIRNYFPIHRRGKFIANFRGPASEEIFISDAVRFSDRVASFSCGKEVFLDLEITVDARASGASAFSYIALESVDLSAQALETTMAGLQFYVNTRRCR